MEYISYELLFDIKYLDILIMLSKVFGGVCIISILYLKYYRPFLLGNVVANLWTWNAMFLIIFFCTVLTEFSESLVRVVVYDDFCCKEPHNSFTAEAKISVAKIKLWNLVKTNNVESIKKVYYYLTSTLAILLFLFPLWLLSFSLFLLLIKKAEILFKWPDF